jgi:hypothetical protein
MNSGGFILEDDAKSKIQYPKSIGCIAVRVSFQKKE